MIFGKWRKHDHEWATVERLVFKHGRKRWGRYGPYRIDECVRCGEERNRTPTRWDRWREYRHLRVSLGIRIRGWA